MKPRLPRPGPQPAAQVEPEGEAESHSRVVGSGAANGELPVDVGDLVAGKYIVERVLGAGGMGIVLVAHHLELERKVAIKFLLPEAANTESAARFKREARAMARLQSEHVVRVIDVGTLPTGEPYMVMEYLEGSDLSKVAKVRGPLPIDDTLDYILQGCEAIAEAHAMGIVHRDLKPSNLYLARRLDGAMTVKLLDFGIAKMSSSDAAELQQSFTTTTALLGSPVYMAPEQLQCSRDADARADIWSLGAIVFKLLTGRPPFIADTMPQVCTLIMSAPPASLLALRPDVPAELEAVLFRCLAKNPADRFQNVAELAIALAPFAPARAQRSVERATSVVRAAGGTVSLPAPSSTPSVGESSVSRSLRGAALAQPFESSQPSLGAQAPLGRRSGIRVAIAVGFAVVGIGVLGMTLLSGRRSARSAEHVQAKAPPSQPVELALPSGAPPMIPNTGGATATPGPAATNPPASINANDLPSTRSPKPAAVAKPKPPPRTGGTDNSEFGGRK